MVKCDPVDLATAEKRIGVLTSVASGALAYALMYVFEISGVPVTNASALMTLTTNSVGYVLDVLIAKQCFRDFGSPSESRTLDSVRERLIWLARSLISFAFVRFCITVFIDIIVSSFVLRYVRSLLDSAGILKSWRWRDTVVALLISVVNFNLFVNRIRFDWAYNTNPDPVMDLIMFSWFSSLVVSHIIFDRIDGSIPQKSSGD